MPPPSPSSIFDRLERYVVERSGLAREIVQRVFAAELAFWQEQIRETGEADT